MTAESEESMGGQSPVTTTLMGAMADDSAAWQCAVAQELDVPTRSCRYMRQSTSDVGEHMIGADSEGTG